MATQKINLKDPTEETRKRAKKFTSPEFLAAASITTWEDKHDFNSCLEELELQVKASNNGSIARSESMLLSQAHTLDTLFNNLARSAHIQTLMPRYEAFLRLAFKAQAQCRQTLETLSTIKNPPVIFAKQANISNGHQQINNGVTSQVENNQKQQNELLTELPNATLDIRGKDETITINQAMETMEEINRR